MNSSREKKTTGESLRSRAGMAGLAFVFGMVILTAGCSLGPRFSKPEFSDVTGNGWKTVPDMATRFAAGRQPQIDWWRQFDDPALTSLVEQLFSSSLSLARARERIVEVTARQGVVGAQRRVQLAAALGYTRAETGEEAVSLQRLPPGQTLEVYSAGVTANWEIDLWGRVARLLEAGEADIGAGYASYQDMMVSLAAEVTQTYIEMRTLAARIANIREKQSLQLQTLKLAEDRLAAGNGAELEVVRAQRLLSMTRSRLPELERSLAQAKNRIHVLLGLAPAELSLDGATFPQVPAMIGIGLPADLLTRRPDIRYAMHRYHAAVARTGAAEAEKYPTLSLSGTLTLSSDIPGNLVDGRSLIYTLGPGLHFPLWTGGRLDSNVAVQRSRAEQARLDLKQQTVAALAEVENAATGVVRTQERLTELAAAEQAATRSVKLANDLYRSGLGDVFQLLDNQQQLVAVEEELLIARQQALTQVVGLYRALGGGWQWAMPEQTAGMETE